MARTARPGGPWPYLLALAVSGLGLAVKATVASGIPHLYLLLLPGVFVAAGVGGLGPGLLATATAALGANYWFVGPAGRLWLRGGDAVTGLGLFVVLGIAISVGAHVYRRRVEAGAALAASERALRQSEAVYRALADSLPGFGVALFDRDLRYVLVQNRGGTATGEAPSALVGRTVEETYPSPQREQLVAAFRSALAGNLEVFDITFGDRTLEGRVAPVRGEDGRILMGIATSEDVTERRAAQERMQVASRLAALGTLVAGVAHEVNNPLAAALANQALAVSFLRSFRAQVLRGEAADPAELLRELDELLEGLGDAGASLRRISRIVKDLAAFGRSDQRRTRVRLLDAVEQAMRWVPTATLAAPAIEVREEGAPDVMARLGQMTQVAVNLITNAARAIPPGRKGTIRIRVGTGRDGTARLEVEDDGAGMTPEVMARVFDPFFTTREVGQGMGLGLSVAHAIVTEHGGTVTVRSELGKGSTFTVELPAARDDGPAAIRGEGDG